jgi:hypothetical protein
MIYEGVYTWGAEVEVFTPRGSQKGYWVLTTEPLWLRLSMAHQELTTQPYEGIFVQVLGYYDGPATEERGGAFAEQYEGLFQIVELREARKTSASDCTTTSRSP